MGLLQRGRRCGSRNRLRRKRGTGAGEQCNGCGEEEVFHLSHPSSYECGAPGGASRFPLSVVSLYAFNAQYFPPVTVRGIGDSGDDSDSSTAPLTQKNGKKP
ncbi:hypothetical protein LMG27198_12880 [Methylocystis echinoides]|uniref:Uncharacterized protein n=1 Tax=Methylocystis echinoides TaxID=29468 RepID=A0A9W6GSY6_9HYPH|nr:hypothetical protein LMG27198_12880 [Methylocystis echinoides]